MLFFIFCSELTIVEVFLRISHRHISLHLRQLFQLRCRWLRLRRTIIILPKRFVHVFIVLDYFSRRKYIFYLYVWYRFFLNQTLLTLGIRCNKVLLCINFIHIFIFYLIIGLQFRWIIILHFNHFAANFGIDIYHLLILGGDFVNVTLLLFIIAARIHRSIGCLSLKLPLDNYRLIQIQYSSFFKRLFPILGCMHRPLWALRKMKRCSLSWLVERCACLLNCFKTWSGCLVGLRTDFGQNRIIHFRLVRRCWQRVVINPIFRNRRDHVFVWLWTRSDGISRAFFNWENRRFILLVPLKRYFMVNLRFRYFTFVVNSSCWRIPYILRLPLIYAFYHFFSHLNRFFAPRRILWLRNRSCSISFFDNFALIDEQFYFWTFLFLFLFWIFIETWRFRTFPF